MAVNVNVLRRPSDRTFYLAAALLFPAIVFAGYFRSYYFRPFFMDVPLPTSLVHVHGIVMSSWVAYFSVQVALIRTKNYKLHMTMGFVGIALASIVIVVGMATAYDAHLVRLTAPGGIDPYSFFIIPVTDLLFFVAYFAGAIYWRKRPAEHKSLMLMTAINFLPPALGRMSPLPENMMILWTFGVPCIVAIACLVYHWRRHGRLNTVFAVAVAAFVVSFPLRIFIAGTQTWHDLVAMIAPTVR